MIKLSYSLTLIILLNMACSLRNGLQDSGSVNGVVENRGSRTVSPVECDNSNYVAQKIIDLAINLKNPIQFSNGSVTYCQKLTKEDGLVSYVIELNLDGVECNFAVDQATLEATEFVEEFNAFNDEVNDCKRVFDNIKKSDIRLSSPSSSSFSQYDLNNSYYHPEDNTVRSPIKAKKLNNDYLIFDTTNNPEIVNAYWDEQFADERISESKEDKANRIQSLMNQLNPISSYFSEDSSEEDNTSKVLKAGGYEEADWKEAAKIYSKMVILQVLKGKTVYKQNVLSAKKQLVNGFNYSIVFQFDDITCQLQAYEPFVKNTKYSVYYHNLQNSVFNGKEYLTDSLGYYPFTHTNCVDVLGASL